MAKSMDLQLDPYDPVEFVTRICSMLVISENSRRSALKILSKAKDAGFSTGKNPMSLVGAAVYLATLVNDEKKAQNSIAKSCGVSNVSVRNIAKQFIEKLGYCLN
jgi:transcription initiation factor TFIIB